MRGERQAFSDWHLLFLFLQAPQSLGFRHIAVQIAELLTFDFDFGEENFPFVAIFLHLVLLLFAGVFLLFSLLRFEANLLFSLCGS